MHSGRADGSVLQDQRGIILPLILVFLALGLLLIVPTLGQGYSALAGTGVTENKAEELHAADSGLEEALYWLTRDQFGDEYQLLDSEDPEAGWYRVDYYPLNRKQVDVTIVPFLPEGEEQEDYFYLITSTAVDPQGGSSTVLAVVYAPPYITIIEGPFELGLNTDFEGDLYVEGDLDLLQNSSITGNVYAEGDVTLGNHSTINSDVICVGGDLTLGNNTEIGGMELEAEIHFLNLEEDGSTMTLNEAGTEVRGTIYAWGDLTIIMNQPSTIEADVVVYDGNLTVQMNSNGTISGSLFTVPDRDIEVERNMVITMSLSGAELTGNMCSYGDVTITTKGAIGTSASQGYIHSGGDLSMTVEGGEVWADFIYSHSDMRVDLNENGNGSIDANYIYSEGTMDIIVNNSNQNRRITADIYCKDNVNVDVVTDKSIVDGALYLSADGTYEYSGDGYPPSPVHYDWKQWPEPECDPAPEPQKSCDWPDNTTEVHVWEVS